MKSHHDMALQAVQEALLGLCIESRIQDGRLRFSAYPSLALFPSEVHVETRDTPAAAIYLSMIVALNVDRPDTFIASRLTGLGSTIRQAMIDAASYWTHCVVPPILSVLHREPSFGAVSLPHGDPAGLPGWNIFSSAYMIRAGRDDPAREALMKHLQAVPLLPTLSPALLPILNRNQPYTTLMFYRGQVGSQIFAEAMINGEEHEALTAALREAPWPRVIPEDILSFRLFLFCMRVKTAG